MPATVRNPDQHWVRTGTTISPTILTDKVGIGIKTALYKLHLYKGASGGTAVDGLDTFVLENNKNAGFTILTADNWFSRMAFGSPSDGFAARLEWKYDDKVFRMGTATADGETAIEYGNKVEGIRLNSVGNAKFVGGISSGTRTISTSGHSLNVRDVNTVFINITSDIILEGLTGGIDGQVLNFVYKGDYTHTATFEDTAGSADQDFYMHTRADETIDGGGITFVCDGSNWFDASHARHV